MDKGHTKEDKYVANIFNEYKDFVKDKHVLFVIKKTERIVYGIYMLSHCIPASDPLHTDIKKTSHVLLETTSQFVSPHHITPSSLTQVHAHLAHLSSLLTLAYMENYISQGNVEIIKHEINYLHKHIEELSTTSIAQQLGVGLKADQFVVAQSRVHTPSMSFKKSQAPSKQSAPATKSARNVLKELKAPAPVSFKKPTASNAQTSESRDLSIIRVIQDKGEVSIKDISTVIFDISEKTIQRTLQALIDKGQITKSGERRWARYRLK